MQIPLETVKSMPGTPSTKNNGGETDYYALPTIKSENVTYILTNTIKNSTLIDCRLASDKLLKEIPTTLNDLIEFKEMKPWQHEVMKACYAINERAAKNGGSELRELNKIIYYTQRRINQLNEK